jgi:DNA primase large subunit
MLWALLFYYLFSSSSHGLVKDVAKPVKQYVHDEARAKQIIATNKEMQSEETALEKDTKKIKKRLAKLNENRLTSEAEFQALFAALDLKSADAREKILDSRFKMKGLMTAEEWNNVHVTAGPLE